MGPNALSSLDDPASATVLNVGIALLTASLTILIFLASGRRKNKNLEHKYPPYLPSPTKPNAEAGWMEKIAGVTGNEAPQFFYKSFQALQSTQTWICRLRLPQRHPNPCGFVIADASIAKAVLSSDLSTKPAGYDEFDYVCGGPNILSTNGIQWKAARKGVAPAFSSNHIKRMNRICAEQLDLWKKNVLDPLAEEGKSFGVGKEMIYLTLRVICEAAFEYEMSQDEMDEFIEAFEVASREFIIWNPLHRNFQFLFPQVWQAKSASKVLQAIAHKIMASFRKRQEERSRKQSTAEKKESRYQDDTIISRIVNNQSYANDRERAAEIIIFLVAGHDTTAFSIAWTLIEVSKSANDTELLEYRKITVQMEKEEWRKIDASQSCGCNGLCAPVG